MQSLNSRRLRLANLLLLSTIFLLFISGPVVAQTVSSERPEYNDVYAVAADIDEIYCLVTGQSVQREYTFEIIGNYDSKNTYESLSNGDKIKLP